MLQFGAAMLFAFGSNGNGQLGIGNVNDQDTPQMCHIVHEESQPLGTLTRIVAGGNHTLALFDSGRLFSAGSNDNGQSGPKSRVSPSNYSADLHTIFTEVTFSSTLQKVKLCSATWEASIIVTINDEVYAFGNGPHGELGTRTYKERLPQQLAQFGPSKSSIVEIASGVRHTVVIFSNGEVYGWGNARNGQLGQCHENMILSPRKIADVTFNVSQVTCGLRFTYLLGDPWKSEYQILGSEKWDISTSIPSPLRSSDNALKGLDSNWSSISALDASGSIVCWGRNDRGQLPPRDLPLIEEIAMGSEHTIALTKTGEVLAWGWGEHGNCGPATDEDACVRNRWQTILPRSSISETKVVKIGAGCATSFIWTASDETW